MTDSLPLVLVADDYPENRRLFTLYLRKTYRVVDAESGEEVMERLKEQLAAGDPVEVALLDLNYQGGMTGFDALDAIRADPTLAATPTAALTAHASPEDRARCLAAGFDAYLSKPVMRGPMLETVASMIAQKVPA